jgi:hypothetical protein
LQEISSADQRVQEGREQMTHEKTGGPNRIDYRLEGGITALKRLFVDNGSRISSAVVLMAVAAAACSAQNVTSAHSGTLHYFEGDVSVDNTPIQSKAGRFPEIKEQSVLRTAQGRAEVLLTPGVFLRVGESSALKMLDNRLVSTRVEIISGTVIVESDDPQMSIKDSPVTLIYGNYAIHLVKHGLVEISSAPTQMKVYKGEAVVEGTSAGAANEHAIVGEGRLLAFSAALRTDRFNDTERFNDKIGDDLYLWARDRSQSLSAANMSSALSLKSNGSGYGNGYGSGSGFGLGNWTGGWYFNPYFNAYTFVPAGGMLWNAWGYGFFSPATISSYYTPSNYWYGGGGARGTGSIGRPLSEVADSTGTHAAPLSSIRSGNSGGLPALGLPVRGGTAIGAGTGSSMGPSRTGFADAIGGHASTGGGHGY